MIEDLKRNIEQEKEILIDINSIQKSIGEAEISEKRLYSSSLNSLLMQLRILNNTVPKLLEEISPVKKLSYEVNLDKTEIPKRHENIIKVSYISPSTNQKKYISINKEDKNTFAKELRLSESALLNLKKKRKDQQIVVNKPSSFARTSNKLFAKYSDKLSPYFSSLSQDLKKSNSRFLTSTYLSISMFIISIVFVSSLVLFLTLGFLFNLFNWIWVPFILTFATIIFLYLYPTMEKGSVKNNITQELPFATIHMAAIASSNIEPSRIFRIIASSPEYPFIARELRKLVNQVDIYGYDLVNALKNSAKQTSNKRLADLFIGLATTISSGGDLKNYLEKKAENYLVDYKLERQRYSSVAETFMDIYISILIAAPLILMTLLVIMNITGLQVGLSFSLILFLSIAAIILVNILFMIFLEIKQPKI